jgi:hypothetical protein
MWISEFRAAKMPEIFEHAEQKLCAVAVRMVFIPEHAKHPIAPLAE